MKKPFYLQFKNLYKFCSFREMSDIHNFNLFNSNCGIIKMGIHIKTGVYVICYTFIECKTL